MSRNGKMALVRSANQVKPSNGIDGINPLRAKSAVRGFLTEALVKPSDLVQSLLVFDRPYEHPFLPTICLENARQQVRDLVKLGIRGVKLFTEYADRDAHASAVCNPDNLMLKMIKLIKDEAPELCVIPETCVCTGTDTGMCVLVDSNGKVDLKRTLDTLAQSALLQAEAGADIVGPSGMVDGAVRVIREELDAVGYHNVPIMPHLILNTALYELYRHAMGLQARVGKLRPFHIDPSQHRQPQLQAEQFLNDGADMILLEPSMFTVDVLVELRRNFQCPLGAFCVSGEYKMLLGSSVPGIVDGNIVFNEFFSGLKRAGADFIVTYAAKDTAKWLIEQH